MKRIGELIDQELKVEYENAKEHAKETKIMAKGLEKGRNYKEMEEVWNKSEHSETSEDSPKMRHSKSKSLQMTRRAKSTLTG